MNSLVEFKGVLAPIPTPFTKDHGKIYEKGIYNLCNFLKDSGVHGVFALGSYGSFPLLDPDERIQAMQLIAKACIDFDLYSIMHIGAAGTDQALRYLFHAENLGVDAVASISPFYYSGDGYRWQEIRAYHERLITETTLPYCIYNNPKTTSFAFSKEQLVELVEIGASALKDSGNNTHIFLEYLDATSDYAFNCMPGSGSMMLDCFQAGASAIVAGTAVAFPQPVMKLYNAIIEKHSLKQLKILQDEVSNCRERQAQSMMRPAAVYGILREYGIDIGYPKKPWADK